MHFGGRGGEDLSHFPAVPPHDSESKRSVVSQRLKAGNPRQSPYTAKVWTRTMQRAGLFWVGGRYCAASKSVI